MREQLDRHMVHNWEVYEREHGKHWKVLRKHGQKYYKKVINRSERRKANINPECIPSYKQYYGWEW
jgi:hypothetical protein